MKSLYLALALIMGAHIASAQFVDITLVHNAPDPAAATVDIYITQGGITNKIEDLEYRSAQNISSVVTLFPDLEVTIQIAPGNSADPSQALITERLTAQDGEAYVMSVIGVVNPAGGWAANPAGVAIGAQVKSILTVAETSDPTKTGVYLLHGSTDFDACDVYVRGRTQALATNFKFGSMTTTMVELARERVTFDFTQVGQKTKVLASFSVDLAALSGVNVYELSGFKTPGDNKSSTDTLSLIAVQEDAQVVVFPLLAGSQTARVQLVHNVPVAAAGVVDLYLDGERRIDNFGFRKATAFADMPAGQSLNFGIAPATSKDAKEIFATISVPALRPGRAYTMIVNGITDTAAFAKNPEGRNITVSIMVLEGALEASAADGKTSIRVAHGATDAPTVVIESDGTPFGNPIGYGEASAEYAAVEPAQDTLWVTDPASKKRLKGYVADLRGNKKAFVALASGFLDPAANGNGAAFRLLLIDASGAVNATMPEVKQDTSDTTDTTTSVREELVPASAWMIAPIPADDEVSIAIDAPADAAQFTVYDVTGTVVARASADAAGRLQTTISTTGMPPGTYLIRATLPDGRLLGTSQFVRR